MRTERLVQFPTKALVAKLACSKYMYTDRRFMTPLICSVLIQCYATIFNAYKGKYLLVVMVRAKTSTQLS